MKANDALVEAVLNASSQVDGKPKLSCVKALVIAKEFCVNPAEVGKICNDRNIKISSCQLGCFK